MKGFNYSGWFLVAALSATAVVPANTFANDRPSITVNEQEPEPIKALLRQAEYWRANDRDDLAANSLRRVLAANPGHVQANYHLGLIAFAQGDERQLERSVTALREYAPNASVTRDLQSLAWREQRDVSVLREARQAAAADNARDAVANYERLFENGLPPADIALEYYQTLSAVPSRRQEAIDGLARLREERPGNRQIEIAYAEVLTYSPETRIQGISLLESLWQDTPSEQIKAPWRQALIWLGADQRHVSRFQRYQLAHGQDDDIARLLRQASERAPGADRAAGFSALNQGRLNEAERAFRAAIRANNQDWEAHGGLGLTFLQREQFEAAETSLSRAMQLSPSNALRWRDARQTAAFYSRFERAQALADDGETQQALNVLAPLTRDEERADVARQLQAQLLIDSGDAARAEQIYRDQLQRQPDDMDARLGLAQSLLAQERRREAERVLDYTPAEARQQRDDFRPQRVNLLRREASYAMDAGDIEMATARLERAIHLDPSDPWARLDLALLYQQHDKSAAARQIMAPLLIAPVSTEGLFASALLAAEQARWRDAEALVLRIPESQRDEDMTALLVRVRRDQRIQNITRQLESGTPARVQALLDGLYRNPPEDPIELGGIAMALHEAGETNLALLLVRRQLGEGLSPPALQYTNHVMVFSRAGLSREAEQLTDRLFAMSSDDERETLANLQIDMALAEAQQLQDEGRLADAYDVLTFELERQPHHVPLLLSLARLYEAGGLTQEAQDIRQFVLQRDMNQLDARRAAANTALAKRQPREALEYLTARGDLPLTASDLLIKARAHDQLGQRRTARDTAFQARDAELVRLSARGDLGVRPSPVLENPFARAERRASTFAAPSAPDRRYRQRDQRVWMPGEQQRNAPRWHDAEPDARWSQSPWYADEQRTPDWQALADSEASPRFRTPNSPLLNDIDTYIDGVDDALAFRATADTRLRRRSGEKGLSALTEISSQLRLSAVPFESSRATVTVTPVYLNAGRIRNSALPRFASGSLYAAGESLDEALVSVSANIDEINDVAMTLAMAESELEAAQSSENIQPQELQRLENVRIMAQMNFDRALERNVFFEGGIDLGRLSPQQRAQVDQVLLDNFGTADLSLTADNLDDFDINRERLEFIIAGLRDQSIALARRARVPENQRDSGGAVNLRWQWQQVDLDIGTTPLGFETRNVLGGLSWNQPIADNNQFTFTVQRRDVKDSILSWSGIEDPSTGRRWGGVVRTGGEMMLTHDDGNFGVFGVLGAYRFTGKNVADNSNAEMTVGAYVRPINDGINRVQTGVNASIMGFRRNLSQFTIGHGGYFSPQDFVSLSFPISYQRSERRLDWRVHFTPGFQSFSYDSAPIFPTNSQDQSWLDILATAGVIEQSRYDSLSESGMGITVGTAVSYLVSPSWEVGLSLDHDTFGEFAETMANFSVQFIGGRSQ